MTKKPLSIYVHVPFCLSKCKYCSFYSEIYNEIYIERYFKSLKSTAKYFSSLKENENVIIKTIYFGGGTPTCVKAELLSDFLLFLKETFTVSSECEITIEANPKTVTKKSAIILKESGFNRVSLGIQTTDNERLKLIGRIHTFEDAKEAYTIFREAGFSNISMDLIYALPNTDISHVYEDLNRIISLSPEHISTYALSIEEGTPLFKERDKYNFPDDEKQLEMYLAICQKLSSSGYYHYEISNFSKKGYESKHNLTYWERGEYLGIGAGAHSYWRGSRFYSEPDKLNFISLTENGDFISASGLNNGEKISEEDKAEEEIMLSLRTSKGLKHQEITPYMKKVIDSGYARHDGLFFSLTDKGYFVSNTIIYNLCKELIYDKQ